MLSITITPSPAELVYYLFVSDGKNVICDNEMFAANSLDKALERIKAVEYEYEARQDAMTDE